MQERANPILCMRPVKCRGLPIFLLHPVFAKYLSLSKGELPATREATSAVHVARELCHTMGNAFDHENDRRDAFFNAIRPLFSPWATSKEVSAQGATVSTRTDMTISANGTSMVLIEIKNGKEGDGYMQASRGYEVVTEELAQNKQKFVHHGAPMFICCLSGQSRFTLDRRCIPDMVHTDEELRIAGAFKDGEQAVVEPLSYNLLYPDFRQGGRMMQVAQTLFALYSCLEDIAKEINRYGISSPGYYIFLRSKLPSPEPPSVYAPSCPRVFSTIRNPATNQDQPLEFIQLRKDLWDTDDETVNYLNLIYEANFAREKVLAKVVPCSYGTNVHTHLAAKSMAPRLYATSNLHDLVSVVVMELLKDGWTTLYNYRENTYPDGIPEESRTRLLGRMEAILGCLEAGRMVHGDFRAANIMLKPGEEANAMLIDFDWAGEAGVAKYPFTRNDLGYPGQPGGFIAAEHDRTFYETWKDRVFKPCTP